ncbi:hypothetical protein EHW99_3430 [Erwinia amylovora]|nr:hypothetical protein EHX00_3430 [Erwinia amylovora]QJQ59828.1 hypothetical protein EHW99_3430 [Erwinia amylovora]QJQ63527.1 hypothetical protein EHW98_3430 [Erwinia amylovora]QJQ67329.1 hypothetical protein EHW96_3430 [Erwinia amylovora]QJQ71028.1 hypothetical protein EGZ89_3430 [Erwinia amylovora]
MRDADNVFAANKKAETHSFFWLLCAGSRLQWALFRH